MNFRGILEEEDYLSDNRDGSGSNVNSREEIDKLYARMEVVAHSKKMSDAEREKKIREAVEVCFEALLNNFFLIIPLVPKAHISMMCVRTLRELQHERCLRIVGVGEHQRRERIRMSVGNERCAYDSFLRLFLFNEMIYFI
jgi:hypothetical protein